MTHDSLSPQNKDLLGAFREGKPIALARVISIVENHRPGFQALLHELLSRPPTAARIGLTGPPGAGKSTLVAGLATVVVAVTGCITGWVLARHEFKGRELVDALLNLPLVLPPTVTGYYLIVLLGRRGLLGEPLYALTGWSVPFTARWPTQAGRCRARW